MLCTPINFHLFTILLVLKDLENIQEHLIFILPITCLNILFNQMNGEFLSSPSITHPLPLPLTTLSNYR